MGAGGEWDIPVRKEAVYESRTLNREKSMKRKKNHKYRNFTGDTIVVTGRPAKEMERELLDMVSA